MAAFTVVCFFCCPGHKTVGRGFFSVPLTGLPPSQPVPAPSSKARFNFLEGGTQVLWTHLTLKTQEPENNKGSNTGNPSPSSRASPQRPGGGGRGCLEDQLPWGGMVLIGSCFPRDPAPPFQGQPRRQAAWARFPISTPGLRAFLGNMGSPFPRPATIIPASSA